MFLPTLIFISPFSPSFLSVYDPFYEFGLRACLSLNKCKFSLFLACYWILPFSTPSHLFSSDHRFFMGFKPGDWGGHCRTWLLFFLHEFDICLEFDACSEQVLNLLYIMFRHIPFLTNTVTIYRHFTYLNHMFSFCSLFCEWTNDAQITQIKGNLIVLFINL